MKFGLVQANHDEDQQGIEHIGQGTRSISQKDEVVQVNEEVNQQGVEHIRDGMLSFLLCDGGAQASEDEQQQEIENVQNIFSISVELLEFVENEDLQGKNNQLCVLKC